MKKIIFLFTVLLSVFFLSTDNVYASNINLSTPSRACIDSVSPDGTNCFVPLQGTYWDNPYFTTYGNGYLGNPGSTSSIGVSANFQWDTIGLCTGKNLLITGYIAGIFDLFNNVYDIKVYNNNTELSCTFVRENSSRIKYTCSGIGGGKFQINVNLNSFPRGVTYDVGISKVVDVSCDVSNADIITSNKQNSQDIINNQNSNSQKEIDNANKNQQETNKRLDELNGNIKDSSVDSSGAEGFFNNFEDKDFGLSDIITLPLDLIKSITSSTCTDLKLPLPYVNKEITLPCMSVIYSQWFGRFYQLYQRIMFGIIAYYVCVNTYALVKGFKDPNSDKIEVMEL